MSVYNFWSQIPCENFVRNLFGGFKDFHGCTIPPGNNSNRPLFLMSNFCQPRVICLLIFQKWHGFCCPRISRLRIIYTRNILPPGT